MTAIWQKMHARSGESDIAQLQREVLTGQLAAFLKFKTDENFVGLEKED